MKVIWKVSDVPTGPYRSFGRRGWPTAFYGSIDGPVCATIYCSDAYEPSRVRAGNHAPLLVQIADHRHKPGFKWRKLNKEFATLGDAKAAVADILARHLEVMPS